MSAIDRRRLLVSGIATTAFVAMQPWRSFVRFVEPSTVDLLPGVLPDVDSTRRVGHAFLRAHPDEADRAQLIQTLTHSLGASASASRTELAVLATRAIQHELRSRTTIRLDGWVAAPTEARLAALTTLVSRRPSADPASARAASQH